MNKFNILFLASGACWKNALWKNWQHQDAILKYACKELNGKITVGIPMNGSTYYQDLLKGKDARVQTGWKQMEVDFSPNLYKGEFDAIVLELAEFWNDLEINPKTKEVIKGEVINQYVEDTLRKAMEDKKPILLFDPDGFIQRSILIPGNKNMTKWAYDICEGYEKLTVASPIENQFDLPCNQFFLPYNVDPESLVDEINPKSRREFLTRYVGNNLNREQFVQYFDACSKLGRTEVRGKFWGKYKTEYPDIEWGPKFAFTQERVPSHYGDMLIGLYGTLDELADLKHYTLRIREYLQAGVIIVPERDYIIEKLVVDEFPYTAYDLLDESKSQEMIDRLTNMSDEEYSSIVHKQREKALEVFSALNYVNDYVNALKL